ncbi:MAG: hypothetical protein Salg2KO_20200 [Salibacteraceae bacterium]
MPKPLGLLIFLLIFLTLNGCRPDDELTRLQKTPWSPEIVLPLANADIEASQILSRNNSSALTAVDDDVIALTYDADIYSLYGSELVPLVDQLLRLIPSKLFYEIELNNSALINYLLIAQGKLEIDVQGPARNEVGNIVVSIPSLNINDNAYYHVYSSIEALRSNPIDLAGASLSLGNDSIEYNVLEASVKIFDNNEIEITENFTVYLKFQELIMKLVKGWFNELDLDFEEDTIDLDIFEHWKSGSILLENPIAKITMSNSIGIPITASVETMSAQGGGEGGLVVPIDYSKVFGQSFVVPYPGISDVERYVNSTYELDKTNSNLRNVIEISPQIIRYHFNLIARQQVNLDEVGEIQDTSRLTINTSVTLPFTCSIRDVLVSDTIAISNASLSSLSGVESAELMINTDNGLPIDLDIQLYMLDQTRLILDSVFTSSRFLNSGLVNAMGRVVQREESSTSIETTNEQIKALENTKYIAIVGKVATANSGIQTVAFQSTNSLGIDLSLRVKYRIQ